VPCKVCVIETDAEQGSDLPPAETDTIKLERGFVGIHVTHHDQR
jgi:hypothetical protein